MQADIRTLVLTPDFPPAVGGIQTVMHRLVQHADALNPHVVTLSHPGSSAFDDELDVTVRRVAPATLGYRTSIGRLNVTAIVQALRFRPDAVLSGHIVMAPAAVMVRRMLGVPIVQYLHGHELAMRPRLTSFAVRHADASIAVSASTRDVAIAAGASPERVHVIPPGADLPPDLPRHRDSAPTVLTVGRLRERYKGHDVMLRALPLIATDVPDVRWVIVGDGPLRGELEALAVRTGMRDRVLFAGEVSDADRDEWFRRAHVFSMPARRPAEGIGEGFGIVFLEANLHGLPVVAGAVGGALDAVVDGVTGVLIDPNDHVAVAHAVSDLLKDPKRAQHLGAAGAERARRDFNWPAIAARVQALIRSLAAPRR